MKVSYSKLDTIAGENLADRKVVYLSDVNTVKLAKADSETTIPAIGFTDGSALNEEIVRIVTNDLLDGFTSLVAGNSYYLSQTNAGEITNVKPSSGIIVRLGVAKNSTELDVHILRIETKDNIGLGNVDNVQQLPLSQKGMADGVATLGADSKIPPGQLPALAITDTYVATNETEQLALTIQKGDVCVRTDQNKSYINVTGNNTSMSDWQELLTPTDMVARQIIGGSALNISITDDNTYYLAIVGGKDVTEAEAELYMPFAGTVSNFYMYVKENTIADTTVTVFRKNGVDQDLIINWGSEEAGLKTDLVNSFSVNAGDRITIRVTTPAVAGTQYFRIESISFAFIMD